MTLVLPALFSPASTVRVSSKRISVERHDRKFVTRSWRRCMRSMLHGSGASWKRGCDRRELARHLMKIHAKPKLPGMRRCATARRRLTQRPDAQRARPTSKPLSLSTSRDIKTTTPLPYAQSPSAKIASCSLSSARKRRQLISVINYARPRAENRNPFAIRSASSGAS